MELMQPAIQMQSETIKIWLMEGQLWSCLEDSLGLSPNINILKLDVDVQQTPKHGRWIPYEGMSTTSLLCFSMRVRYSPAPPISSCQ